MSWLLCKWSAFVSLRARRVSRHFSSVWWWIISNKTPLKTSRTGCCYLSHSLSRIAINSVSHMACHEVTLCCYKHCKDTVSQSSLADMISHSFDVYQLKNIFITFSIFIMKCLFWLISVRVLSTFSILYQDWINRRSIFSTWKRDINDL